MNLTLWDLARYLGNLGPILLLTIVLLLGWALMLILQTKPLSNYVAFIAATLWPLILGIVFSANQALHLLGAMTTKGIDEDAVAVSIAGEMVLSLWAGSLVTCLFLPLGIGLLLFAVPNNRHRLAP